jgi:hypothetical protein
MLWARRGFPAGRRSLAVSRRWCGVTTAATGGAPNGRLGNSSTGVPLSETNEALSITDLPSGMRKHLRVWGKALVEANFGDAQGRRPDTAAEISGGSTEVARTVVSDAHTQLLGLVSGWSADASVYLCGSSVSQNQITAGSDLDFVCIAGGRNAPGHGVVRDRQKQLDPVVALHRHVARFLPTYMQRSFVAMRTARTPVVKFGFTHEPPAKVRISQQIDSGAADLKPAALVNAAAGAVASPLMVSVPSVVSKSKFEPMTAREEELSRTVMLHFRGMTVTKEAILDALAAVPGLAASAVEILSHATDAADRFEHPAGFDAPTSAAEDHSLSLQAQAAIAGARRESTLITARASSGLDALKIFAAFPGDGKVVARTKRDLVTCDFADRRCVPALLRFQWDVSFAGFSVPNSYLLRHYLRGPGSPPWVQHGSLVLKRWARRSHVGHAALGFLTPYAVTIMWTYYLLCVKQVPWLDPGAVPVPAQLPMLPPFQARPAVAPMDNDSELEALTFHLLGFLRFYSDLRAPSEALKAIASATQAGATAPAGFRSDVELVSLNRPRRSTRDDVGWDHSASSRPDVPGFLFCVEDPYDLVGEGGLNLGRHLTAEKLQFINDKIARAVRALLMAEPTDGLTNRDVGVLLGSATDPEPDVTNE